MAVEQNDGQAREGAEQLRQGLEPEVTVGVEFGGAQLRRQIVLAPEILRRAGEDRLGANAIGAPLVGQADHALQIRAGGVGAALGFQPSKRLASQVFGDDGVFLMRLVPRSGWLKVEAESAGGRIFELC